MFYVAQKALSLHRCRLCQTNSFRHYNNAVENVKKSSIKKLLIANRGEIACRVMRTAKVMGIKTVAVYSEVDNQQMHVQMADEAYCIGPAASQESYLKMENIMKVVHQSGAHAIHPGYGFLSENAEFADLCLSERVIFVGPPSSAIRDMGIKSTSKRIMSAANVPIIEGYHGDDQNDSHLLEEAEKIGFPIMIKAVRGGGGKGMRIAMHKEVFMDQLSAARREAISSFGDDVMLIEKYVDRPRHVEVQVFGDHYGDAVYLFERDCSVQRRHQKIIEESPAPGLSEDTRHSIGEAAVRAAKAVGYVGAGTVEFVMDPKQNFYFMEMNTRLQVEHPVTEMVTGVDLVEWQLRVAQGERIPLSQNDIRVSGHAFEARIYAEDPENDFMPGAGTLAYLSAPKESPSVRIETGVRQGDEVSPYYDPMIAKLVVYGPDRVSALKDLELNLSRYAIVGPSSNINFLQRLASNQHFIEGDVHTGFIDQHFQELFPPKQTRVADESVCRAALAYFLMEDLRSCNTSVSETPFSLLKDFKVNLPPSRDITFKVDGLDVTVNVTRLGQSGSEEKQFQITIADETDVLQVSGHLCTNEADANSTEIVSNVNGVKQRHKLVVIPGEANGIDVTADKFYLFPTTTETSIQLSLPIPAFYAKMDSRGATGSQPIAPMTGKVEKVMVSPGDAVTEGQPLVVMIAMKMEHTIRSPRDGVVESVSFSEGDQADKGSLLVTLEGEDSD